MEQKPTSKFIDLKCVFSTLRRKRKVLYVTLFVTTLVAVFITYGKPSYYKCRVALAPEASTGSTKVGGLSSVASTMMASTLRSGGDAIYPMLYPDLLENTDFLVSLFDVPVCTRKGDVETTYSDYLMNHQKRALYSYPMLWIKSLLPSFGEPEPEAGRQTRERDPFMLTRKEAFVADAISRRIKCTVDKKTDVVTFEVTDQDPLVCAQIADTVRCRLQTFITEYRTQKARRDYEFAESLYEEVLEDYNKALERFAKYADANLSIVKQSAAVDRTKLENEVNLKYQAVRQANTSMMTARSKVQDETPAFTVLKRATVPLKPAGPRRKLLIVAFDLLALLAASLYLARHDLFS